MGLRTVLLEKTLTTPGPTRFATGAKLPEFVPSRAIGVSSTRMETGLRRAVSVKGQFQAQLVRARRMAAVPTIASKPGRALAFEPGDGLWQGAFMMSTCSSSLEGTAVS